MSDGGSTHRLEDMSLEALWQLFPILLREHNPEWAVWFSEESAKLGRAFGSRAVRISHIGSTAIPGLLAKPTVDILLELRDGMSSLKIVESLLAAGWLQMYGSGDETLKLGFNKGYTPEGFADRVFHLHVRRLGDPDELYFRDYLMEHPEARELYADLKRDLAQRYEHDRDAYTEGKATFVREITARARELCGSRYSPA